MADETTETEKSRAKMDVALIRAKVAQVVWLVCLAFALCLILGALLIVLGGNNDNDLVNFVKSVADRVDLNVFDRHNGIFHFELSGKKHRGEPDVNKNVLINWGLGAVAWLVLGKVASGLIRK